MTSILLSNVCSPFHCLLLPLFDRHLSVILCEKVEQIRTSFQDFIHRQYQIPQTQIISQCFLSHIRFLYKHFISKGWKWWQDFVNWYNWQCSLISLYLHQLPSPFSHQVSVEHWKPIWGNCDIIWDFILTNIIHQSYLNHTLNCSSLFCHQISVKSTKQSLVATSEVTYICNNFIPHLLFA